MTIVYFDYQTPKQDIYNLAKVLREHFGKNILLLPKNLEVFQDASKEQLLSIKKVIDEALAEK